MQPIVKAFNRLCGYFLGSFSVCCALLMSYNNGETAVNGYNPALFVVYFVNEVDENKRNILVIKWPIAAKKAEKRKWNAL